MLIDDRELEVETNETLRDLSKEEQKELDDFVENWKENVNNTTFKKMERNIVNKNNKEIKNGFDDSNFEKEIIKIRKIGKKLKKENIKVPDIPSFLLYNRKDVDEKKEVNFKSKL